MYHTLICIVNEKLAKYVIILYYNTTFCFFVH
nr:MAG TPA: hypothetical protein [Caudoviricetes sp.]